MAPRGAIIAPRRRDRRHKRQPFRRSSKLSFKAEPIPGQQRRAESRREAQARHPICRRAISHDRSTDFMVNSTPGGIVPPKNAAWWSTAHAGLAPPMLLDSARTGPSPNSCFTVVSRASDDEPPHLNHRWEIFLEAESSLLDAHSSAPAWTTPTRFKFERGEDITHIRASSPSFYASAPRPCT